MLARRYRLCRSPLLNACFKAGNRFCRSSLFDFIGLLANQETHQHPRFTVVVSKKVSNRANKRNLLRRRLKAIIQQDLLGPYFDKVQAYSAIILILKPDALGQSFADLKQEVLRCILKHKA